MSRAVINRIYSGMLLSNVAFKSQKNSYLIMNMDGSIAFKKFGSDCIQHFKPSFVGLDMPIHVIGMDKNGIIRAISVMGIQYPLTMEYNTLDFKPKDVYGSLLDDCSFGVFDKDIMVYRASFSNQVKNYLT